MRLRFFVSEPGCSGAWHVGQNYQVLHDKEILVKSFEKYERASKDNVLSCLNPNSNSVSQIGAEHVADFDKSQSA